MPSYLAFYEQSFFTNFRELHNKNIKECRNCEMKSELQRINQSLSLEWVASKAITRPERWIECCANIYRVYRVSIVIGPLLYHWLRCRLVQGFVSLMRNSFCERRELLASCPWVIELTHMVQNFTKAPLFLNLCTRCATCGSNHWRKIDCFESFGTYVHHDIENWHVKWSTYLLYYTYALYYTRLIIL